MSYETLLYDADGAIATITLNRPQRLNTLVLGEDIGTRVDASAGGG